jgi:hypothetical protein
VPVWIVSENVVHNGRAAADRRNNHVAVDGLGNVVTYGLPCH